VACLAAEGSDETMALSPDRRPLAVPVPLEALGSLKLDEHTD
jgi:hypothetical protein